MTDSAGTVVWAADYKPFGETLSITASGNVTNSLRFPGQYFDLETGLHYNYFRDYNPVTGRYIEADRIGLKGGINLYRYVGNMPLRFSDPRGLAVGDWWDLSANYNRAQEIAREELARHRGHNNCDDATRHVEWSQRMTQELGIGYAWLFGTGHEITGLLQGQPLDEMRMDLHNNAAGRDTASLIGPINPKNLQTGPGSGPGSSYPY
jgi:RHS repeat-associated protein